MKKVKIILMSLLFGLLTTAASAQYKVMYLTLGAWEENKFTSAEKYGCVCGGGTNCICGIGSYLNYISVPQSPGDLGHINIKVISQVLSGNTLLLNFSKVDLKLKSNDFTQKTEVKIDTAIAHSLGYESLIILKGKYSFIGNTSVRLNVKRGSKIVFPPNSKH